MAKTIVFCDDEDHAERMRQESLLDKFADHGVQDIEDAKVLELPPFDQFGSKTQIRRGILCSVEQYTQVLLELEQALYDQKELKQARSRIRPHELRKTR